MHLPTIPYSLIILILEIDASKPSFIAISCALEAQYLHLLDVQPWDESAGNTLNEMVLTGMASGGRQIACICLDIRPEPHSSRRTDPVFESYHAQRLVMKGVITLHDVTSGTLFAQRHRIISATRSTQSAWLVIRERMSEEVYQNVREQLLRVLNGSIPPFPVVRPLGGRSLSARTDLVSFKGGHMVCKTFRPGFEHRFQNELEGLSLSAHLSFIPRLEIYGQNWILFEYCCGFGRLKTNAVRLFPLKIVEKVFYALKAMHEVGYSHLDFTPFNVLSNSEGEIKVIDFEHLFKYRNTWPEFLDSPAVVGSRFFSNEMKWSEYHLDSRYLELRLPTYKRKWWWQTGLPLDVLLSGTRFEKIWRRVLFLAANRLPVYLRNNMVSRYQS